MKWNRRKPCSHRSMSAVSAMLNMRWENQPRFKGGGRGAILSMYVGLLLGSWVDIPDISFSVSGS